MTIWRLMQVSIQLKCKFNLMLWVFSGGEFDNIQVQDFLHSQGCNFNLKKPPNRAVMAENMIGQLKKKIYIQLRRHQTTDWVSILPIITNNMNRSPHPSLGGLIPAELTSKIKAVAVDDARGIPRVLYKFRPRFGT